MSYIFNIIFTMDFLVRQRTAVYCDDDNQGYMIHSDKFRINSIQLLIG